MAPLASLAAAALLAAPASAQERRELLDCPVRVNADIPMWLAPFVSVDLPQNGRVALSRIERGPTVLSAALFDLAGLGFERHLRIEAGRLTAHASYSRPSPEFGSKEHKWRLMTIERAGGPPSPRVLVIRSKGPEDFAKWRREGRLPPGKIDRQEAFYRARSGDRLMDPARAEPMSPAWIAELPRHEPDDRTGDMAPDPYHDGLKEPLDFFFHELPGRDPAQGAFEVDFYTVGKGRRVWRTKVAPGPLAAGRVEWTAAFLLQDKPAEIALRVERPSGRVAGFRLKVKIDIELDEIELDAETSGPCGR